ncbi:MAG: hypothetical protein N3J91_11785 [Verrucomicrobiae bacterium]|nr:hypothetical protein [Verrucomicrobiae bacterium]
MTGKQTWAARFWHLWWAGLFLAATAGSLWPAAPEDVVWLRTGERLRGTITGMTGEGWFRWQHPFINEEMRLALTNVLKIRFGNRESPNRPQGNACQVRLVNGDWLSGQLLGFDGTTLLLENPACGRLQIARHFMDGLQPVETDPRIVYQGPTGLEGWTMGQAVAGVEGNAWVYGNGALIAQKAGSIARDVKLPDLVEISFQVEWEGAPTLALALFTDRLQPIQLANKDEEPAFGGFYSLQISLSGYIMATLVPVKQKLPLNPQGLGIAIHQNRSQESRAHFTIRANKKERLVLLYQNGELLRRWQDPADTLGNGTALRFVNQGQGTLRLSQLVVKHWDGRQALQTNLVMQGTNDLVVLLNQDRVSGTLGTLKDKEWEVLTPVGPVKVPVERIEQLHFSPAARQAPPPQTAALARLTLANQDRLAIQLEQWSEGRLTGKHPLLGRVEINPLALREILFD